MALTDTSKHMPSRTDADRDGYGSFLTICDEFGGRFCSTPGERRAAKYLLESLIRYGLKDVHAEPVDYLSWRRGRAALQVLHPRRRQIRALAFAYSSPTPKEGIEADLVFIPRPTREAFEEAPELGGKAVLTYVGHGVGPACQSTRFAADLGATSLILMANTFCSLQPTGACRWNQAAEIPVIGISREDGEYLLRLMRRGEEVGVRISTSSRMRRARSWNIVAEIPGGSDSREVLLGAHYDGFDVAQSAIDNASGVAVVLQVGRSLSRAGVKLDRTVKFVFFAAEELGMLGSYSYVRQHEAQLRDVVAMVNTDWPGSPASLGVQRPFESLLRHLKESGDAALRDAKQGLGMYSDQFPFTMKGVPAMWVGGPITGRDLEIYHTVFDTADKVPRQVIEESAEVMRRVAVDLASSKVDSIEHLTEEEFRDFLLEEGRSEDLLAEGRWEEDPIGR